MQSLFKLIKQSIRLGGLWDGYNVFITSPGARTSSEKANIKS